MMLKGVFEKKRFLDLIRNYIVFEIDDDGSIVKKMAWYHKYHAVKNAIGSTITESRPERDRRGGVVWHTQGSGNFVW